MKFRLNLSAKPGSDIVATGHAIEAALLVYAKARDLYWVSWDGQETFQELSDAESPDTRTAFELGEWLRVAPADVPENLREMAVEAWREAN